MKVTAAALLLFVPCAVNAFAILPPSSSRTAKTPTQTRLWSTIVTGPTGRAASSFEEDLMLTMQIIRDHEARSTTVTSEQFVQQVEQAAKIVVQDPVDIAIPYDAAAKLAFDASDKSMAYADFKVKYEADAVAAVIAKKKPAAVVAAHAEPETVDISVPYDAAAKLAFEASDKSMQYADFKAKFEADAVASVIAKQKPSAATAVAKPAAAVTHEAVAAADGVVDISIPYDAAAKLAYETSDKSMAYADFKAKFEADAVQDVMAKRK